MHLNNTVNLFCSYASEDRGLFQKLLKYFEPLQRAKHIDIWHEQKIHAGHDRQKEIWTHFYSADIIILLVSPDYLTTDYYGEKMQQALAHRIQQGARVIPILLRPCNWKEEWFAQFQVLPEDGLPVSSWKDKDKAFLQVIKGIQRVLEEQQTTFRSESSFSERTAMLPQQLANILHVEEQQIPPMHTMNQRGHAHLAVLHSILFAMNVTQKTLYTVYRTSVPEDPLHSYGYEDATTLQEMLDLLLTTPVSIDGIPAILKFSERCALLSELHKSTLRGWGDAFAQYLELPFRLLVRFREELDKEIHTASLISSSLPLYLLIVLTPGGEDLQTLRVKAWLCYGQEEPDPLNSPAEKQTYTAHYIMRNLTHRYDFAMGLGGTERLAEGRQHLLSHLLINTTPGCFSCKGGVRSPVMQAGDEPTSIGWLSSTCFLVHLGGWWWKKDLSLTSCQRRVVSEDVSFHEHKRGARPGCPERSLRNAAFGWCFELSRPTRTCRACCSALSCYAITGPKDSIAGCLCRDDGVCTQICDPCPQSSTQ
jgi:hypothetical protein